MSNFCTQCGQPVPVTSRFCASCGTAIGAKEATTPTSPSTVPSAPSGTNAFSPAPTTLDVRSLGGAAIAASISALVVAAIQTILAKGRNFPPETSSVYLLTGILSLLGLGLIVWLFILGMRMIIGDAKAAMFSVGAASAGVVIDILCILCMASAYKSIQFDWTDFVLFFAPLAYAAYAGARLLSASSR